MSSGQPPDRPIDSERAQATLRTMSDTELADLHRQGPEALKPGAWEVVDQEIRRRARVKVRQTSGARFMREYDEEERYPALRAIVFLLKAIAVIVLLIAVIGALLSVSQKQPAGVGPLAAVALLVTGVILAITYWASAEILVLLMDIEHNTRSTRGE